MASTYMIGPIEAELPSIMSTQRTPSPKFIQ